MDKELWTGVLVGVAATILILGGLVTAGATAMGMGGTGGMGGMMDECREMMEDHGHGDQESHDHGGNATEASNTDGDEARTGPAGGTGVGGGTLKAK